MLPPCTPQNVPKKPLLVWKFNSSTVHACTKSVKRDLFETHSTSPQAATKQTPLQRRKNSLIWAVRYGVQKGFPGTICHIFVCYCKSHYLVKSFTKVLKLNDKFHAYLQILFTPWCVAEVANILIPTSIVKRDYFYMDRNENLFWI